MNLNKDQQEIYSVDSNSYTTYMRENRKEPKKFLDSIIKLLLIILLLVLSYFFYNIIEKNLSFGEVFNKKELESTIALLDSEKEDYVETLAKTNTTIEKPATSEAVTVMQKVVTPEPLPVKETATIIKKEELISVKPEVIQGVQEVVKNTMIVEKTTESTSPSIIKEEESSDTLSKNYLEQINKELSSI